MFTVKHVAPDGAELLVECDRFVRERRGDGFWQYTAHHKPPCDNYDYVASWCGDERQHTSGLNDRQTIYVMNRFGSTVAVHTFGQPDFSEVRGEPHVDGKPFAGATETMAEAA